MPDRVKPFDRQTLEMALAELGRKAFEQGKVIDIAIYGGSALVLTMDFRISTRNVDAVFTDKGFVRRIAREIALAYGWDDDWINDGVKGFLDAHDRDPEVKRLLRTYPSEASPGLRVFVPTPEYLFAMKCMAMRLGQIGAPEDIIDIREIAKAIGVTSAGDAMDLVERFYPRRQILPKTRFALEELFPGTSPFDRSRRP